MAKSTTAIKHNKVQTLVFGGLNLTNDTRDGEFSDTLGLTTDGYPFLTQIHTRGVAGGHYSSPTDIFVWNRDLYVVDGTTLKRNGTNIGTVTAGTKRMAVVNTKLVIYPDKKYVDLTDYSMHSLIKESHYWSSSYTITDASLGATGIGNYYAAGDVVDVTGNGIEGKHIVVLTSDSDMLTFAPGSITLDNNSGRVDIKSAVPDLDYICAADNRLWGVSNEDKTLYVSALGDPTTFFDYTSDNGAYAVAIGSEGDFTGICQFGGSVLVWKENMLHKILGQYPSEYYMVDYPVFGVQKGSERSIAVINNILYYKGVFGVYQYSGNRPVNVSAKLGNALYTSAVGAASAKKYYISMADPDGNYHLYAYDTERGLWMKEEDIHVVAFASMDYTPYYIKDNDRYIQTIVEDPMESDNVPVIIDTEYYDPEWMAELVEVTESMFNRKGYTKLLVRLDMGTWSSCAIYAKEDRRPYRKIWERLMPEKKYIVPETSMAGGDVIANCDVDIMAGDKVIISCSGGLYPEEEGDTLVSWHSDGTNLTVPFLISDTEAVTLTYYLDQESEYYKKIAIRRGIESDPAKSYAGNIGLWVPADDNLVTSLVPIRLGRCDRWQLKFEGSGYVTIRGIQREFVTGSER